MKVKRCVRYRNEDCNAFAEFEEMRKREQLTDVTVIAGNRSFPAHRVILAARIPCFLNDWEGEKKITLDETDPGILESLINYAYTGTLEITGANVSSLIKAAHFLEIEKILNTCWTFLEANLEYDNVLEIRGIAEGRRHTQLIRKCDEYIGKNFDKISKSKEFLELRYQSVKKLVLSDDISIANEEMMFEAVIRWINADEEQRESNLRHLLPHIRMSHFSSQYMSERVATERLVKKTRACNNILQDALIYHLSTETRKRSIKPMFNTTPRKYMRHVAWDGVYAICSDASETVVNYLDTLAKKWVTLSVGESNEAICGVAVVGKILYFFFSTTIKTFDLATHRWTDLGSKHVSIDGAGMVNHMNTIYFFGGNVSDAGVRYFHPRENKWLEYSRMGPFHRCLGVVSLQTYIYLTGGLSPPEYTPCKQVIRYDPFEKKCLEMSPMLSKRVYHGCSSSSTKIYVCGGFKTVEDEFLNSAEVYDSVTNMWTFIASMSAPRHSFALTVYGAKVYVLGGQTGNNETSHSVEIYDRDRDQWESGISLPSKKNDPVTTKAVVVC